MRHIFLGLCLLLPALSFAQEEIKLTVYSYSELFEMIEEEPSDVFTLKNAVIKVDSITDEDHLLESIQDDGSSPLFQRTDTIYIKKELNFENVLNDLSPTFLHHIKFEKDVRLMNSVFRFSNSTFNGILNLSYDERFEALQIHGFKRIIFPVVKFRECHFKGSASVSGIRYIDLNDNSDNIPVQIGFQYSSFTASASDDFITIYPRAIFNFYVEDCDFKAYNAFALNPSRSKVFYFRRNTISNSKVQIGISDIISNDINIVENNFNEVAYLQIPEDIQGVRIDWEQFQKGVIDETSFIEYHAKKKGEYPMLFRPSPKLDSMVQVYQNYGRAEDKPSFQRENQLLGTLNAVYKRRHNNESANATYIEIKDLETQRLAYLYNGSPSFDTYFEWKVNQFLKLFSDYGTRPAKAITFSVYVILVFALIYLFFPNHWDSHGKDRILHRYKFFFNYLNKDAGMHDVYLDGKKDELVHYEGFKNFFIENGKTVPKFFLATALPLYRWSTASTRSSSWFLQKIDIFKGRWSDLPPAQRAVKTMLLTLAFAVALAYDIFIKMLNALMLSINTFTTLGFGEIPIKGLPRYLAIIQGFIGWFMLTIFSVSLISQLLN